MNTFNPNYVTVPGATLLDTISSIGMSQIELAQRTGKTPKTINEIIKGKAPITSETAIQFETVLGVPASFWNNLEKNYREGLARIAALNQLKAQVSWLQKFPVQQMISYKWIPAGKTEKAEQLVDLLSFFGISHPLHWGRIYKNLKLEYRKVYSGEPNFNSLTAWLRMGELVARGIDCKPFNQSAFLDTLRGIRDLTTKDIEHAQGEIIKRCAEVGVAVACVRELPKIHVCGATRWLSPEKAMIQLSLIYKTNDQFWFTFFHEAGHIHLHGKKDVFVDGPKVQNQKEDEANKFAEDILLPKRDFDEFKNGELTKQAILQFSYKNKIAPGLVVGRLQHYKVIPYYKFHYLKRVFEWKRPEVNSTSSN
jgi:addiction module HigA family antidote